MVTPLDDTTLIDSHKQGGKFHAYLLAECATVWQLESFFSIFVFYQGWSIFSSLIRYSVCLRLSIIENDFNQVDTER